MEILKHQTFKINSPNDIFEALLGLLHKFNDAENPEELCIIGMTNTGQTVSITSDNIIQVGESLLDMSVTLEEYEYSSKINDVLQSIKSRQKNEGL